MNETEKYWLGCVLSGPDIVQEWRTLRQYLPHPLVFTDPVAQTVAVALEMAADAAREIPEGGLHTFLAEIPYHRFQDVVKTLRRAIAKTYELEPRYASLVLASITDVQNGHEEKGLHDSVLAHIGFPQYAQITGAGMPINGRHRAIAGAIMRHYRRREMIGALEQAREEFAAEEYDMTRIVAGLSRRAERLGRDYEITEDAAVGLDPMQAAEDAGEVETRLRFGIPEMDRKFRAPPGSLIVLAAAPGQGKTALAWQSAVTTALEYGAGSVLYYSFEMDKKTHWERMQARLLTKPLGDIEEGQYRESELAVLRDLKDRFEGCLTLVDQRVGKVGIEYLTADIENHKRNNPNMGFVFIDHLGLIKHTLHGRHSWGEQYGHIMGELKSIAGKLGLVVVVTNQLTRAGREEARSRGGQSTAVPEPRVTDLMGGTAVEADASHIIFLWPETPEDANIEDRSMRIRIAKNRYGPLRTIPGFFVTTTQTVGAK